MIYCGELKNQGILYHTFYDKYSKQLRFYLNGQEVDNDYLYKTYNKTKNCLRGYGRLTTLILSLSIITAAIGVTALDEDISISDIFNSDSGIITIDVQEENELTGEELYNELISRNPDLTEYLEMTKDKVIKYGPYMKQSELLRTIGDLEIIPTSNREEMEAGNALAFYTKDENKIYIDSNINVEYLKKTCLYHEILHYYSQSGLYDFNSYSDGYDGYALNEGMTEMLNADFNDDEMYTYHQEAAYVGALCEIVGPEVFEQAYFGNNIDYLTYALAQYADEDTALALIKNIDIAKDSYDSFVYYDNDEDYYNFVLANENAWAIISNMYDNKYNRDIVGDRLMMAYMSATTLDDYCGLDLEGDSILVDVIVNKHYFNDTNNDFVIVDYNVKNSDGIQGKSLTIEDSERYVNNNNQIKKNKL